MPVAAMVRASDAVVNLRMHSSSVSGRRARASPAQALPPSTTRWDGHGAIVAGRRCGRKAPAASPAHPVDSEIDRSTTLWRRTVDGKRRMTVAGGEVLPDWELLLRAAAQLQRILPDATLVGGTAAALEAGHRRSLDADHVVVGLAGRFDEVLAQLEAVAGWQTDRRQRPVVIMGRLDGIMTTVRNQRRSAPLETREIMTAAGPLRVPTPAEILRIKAWLIVDRNATRDFLDVAAISDKLGLAASARALAPLDRLYPQGDDAGAVRQQLMRQLAKPRPFDLDEVEPRLAEYKGITAPWRTWAAVEQQCQALGVELAEAVANRRQGWTDVGPVS